MTNIKRRITGAIIAATMLAAVGTTTFGTGFTSLGSGFDATISAASNTVEFVNSEGDIKTAKGCTEITSKTTVLDGGWFVVRGDVTIKNRLSVTDESYIILEDGCNLTVKKGIAVSSGVKFNIYSQDGGSGSLYAGTEDGSRTTAGSSDNGIGGKNAEINIIGGRIFAKGGTSAYGICGSTIRLYWTDPENCIYANSYSTKPTLKSIFADRENGKAYNVNAKPSTAELSNVTLSPAYLLDAGTTVLDNCAYAVFGTVKNNKRIDVYGVADIYIADNASLTAVEGISVLESNTLNLCGSGRLYAGTSNGSNCTISNSSYTAIGGEGNIDSGRIIINGPTIYASGAKDGAGIGGCDSYVEIINGNITANGGQYGAGIGGARSSNNRGGSEVRIFGGKIKANGGGNASGIGNGYSASGSTIYIGISNKNDSVYANSYSGNVTIDKNLYIDETGENATSRNIDGKTIVTTSSGITISFETNGGTYISPIKTTYNSYVNAPTAPTRNGYVFDGWYTDKNFRYAFNFNNRVTESVTLYAKWTTGYRVSFETNGGTAMSDVYTNSNGYINAPGTPRKSGYLFDGWYLDRNFTRYFDYRNTRITSNTVLYAKWVTNDLTVTFNTQGGSYVDTQYITYNGYPYKPSDPTKSGYRFIGWYSDKNGYYPFDFNSRITANTTVYACWEKAQTNYTITYDSMGGSYVASKSVKSGAKLDTSPTPKKSGYLFDGWYTDYYCTRLANPSDLVYNDITLYAGWYENVTTYYTISYESNGGSYVASRTVKSGDPIGASVAPTRKGFTFLGWYTDYNCTKLVNLDTPVYNDMTLYADWLEDAPSYVTITHDSKGGSYVASRTVVYGDAIGASDWPTRSGYSFTGWYTDYACTRSVNIYDSVYSDTTLYAGWEEDAPLVTYTVSFNTMGGSYISDIYVDAGKTISGYSIGSPYKSGYDFLGWYEDPGCSYPFSFSTPIYSNTTLYAGWLANGYDDTSYDFIQSPTDYNDDEIDDYGYFGSTFGGAGMIAAIAGGVVVVGGAAAAIIITKNKKNKK